MFFNTEKDGLLQVVRDTSDTPTDRQSAASNEQTHNT